MSDVSPLPWTQQQWATLRGIVQDSARQSRVASRFLPLAGAVRREDQTVPAHRLHIRELAGGQRGEPRERLEADAGETLHLTTIACNVYLRGSEVADPNLDVAKSMVRRAAEVLARLEDAIVFNGLPPASVAAHPMRGARAVVEPVIYTISGGRDLMGLLQVPDTFWDLLVKKSVEPGGNTLKDRWAKLLDLNVGIEYADRQLRLLEPKRDVLKKAVAADPVIEKQWDLATESKKALTEERDKLQKEAAAGEEKELDLLCVRVRKEEKDKTMPIVTAVIDGVQKLERRGHFGPIAAVFGDDLFRQATEPTGTAAVLPTSSFLPFLHGGDLYRSSTIPGDTGLLVALGGAPIELVLATDMDVQFLQMTLEPRYVLRVFERFVLRIKELDAVCRITSAGSCLDTTFSAYRAKP